MKTTLALWFGILALAGCAGPIQAPKPPATQPAVAKATHVPPRFFVADSVDEYPSQRDAIDMLPIFGNPSPGRAKIAITGDVIRPGVYFLPEPVTVRAALDACGGVTTLASPHYSRVFRMQAGVEHDLQGWFKWDDFNAFALQGGDILHLYHEVF
jgi:hypothetical protein